jgi:hypothetical protein
MTEEIPQKHLRSGSRAGMKAVESIRFPFESGGQIALADRRMLRPVLGYWASRNESSQIVNRRDTFFAPLAHVEIGRQTSFKRIRKEERT